MQLWLVDTETMSRLSSVNDRGQSGIKNCQLDMCVSGGFQRIYRARLASNLRLSYLEPQWLDQTEGRGKGGSSRNAERNCMLCQMSVPLVSTKCRIHFLYTYLRQLPVPIISAKCRARFCMKTRCRDVIMILFIRTCSFAASSHAAYRYVSI